MIGFPKSRVRAGETTKSASKDTWQRLRENGGLYSLQIALGFAVLSAGILMFRENVLSYRPEQWVPHDVVSRVDFKYRDPKRLADVRKELRDNQPRIYRPNGEVWRDLKQKLLRLPDEVAKATTVEELPPDLKQVLDSGTLTELRQYHADGTRAKFDQSVEGFIDEVRKLELVILPPEQHKADAGKRIIVHPRPDAVEQSATLSQAAAEDIKGRLQKQAAKFFPLALQSKIVAFTLQELGPTHVLDEAATAEARNRAAEMVTAEMAEVFFPANMPIVPKGKIDERSWEVLKAENEQFLEQLGAQNWKSRIGVAALAFLITAMLAAYVAHFQPKVIRNHGRAVALAVLMLAMLGIAQLAGIGPGSVYFWGVAPTLLVAMIVTIAYDQRFAMGVGSMHALLVTIGLNQGVGFFVILWVGVLTTCFLLDEIRTRSKLIEVAGLSSLAMIGATAAAGAISLDPPRFIITNALYAGAAGLAVGFVVFGILPFVEQFFRITTSMKLLELADASHPLLRRLQMEAPGTYNHSLQVATLAEAAAETIGANSLLCRVASYYHDAGKIKKADYFVENQSGGENRHLNLSPSVSLLIIIGHVKDGIELAKEYNLPTSLHPFIQQHHGTTLVEYFYHQACCQKDKCPEQPAISEMQYRYPGPKPRTREVAIVMLADAVESASRTLNDPTAGRIESLVHDLTMKRLLDGQFDDCDLTMRELEQVERTLVRTLVSIHHGRVAYPSQNQPPATQTQPNLPAVKTA